MPIIPDPSQLSRQSPLASSNVVRLNAGVVEGVQAQAAAQEGAINQGLFDKLGAFSENISRLAQAEQQKLDRLKLADAESALLDSITELSIGEKGYQRVKQGGVLKPEFLKNNTSAFDAAADRVKNSLSTDEQKIEFETVAAKHRSSFSRGVMTHSIRESEAYEETVYKGQLASNINYAQAQFDNPDAVVAGVEGVRATALNRLAQQGVTDQTTIDATILDTVGAVHGSVVEAARKAGRVQYANDYLASKRAEMPAKTAMELEEKLRPSLSFEVGNVVGNEAFALKEAGASATDVQKLINSKTQDPESRRAAQSVMLELEQARKKDIEDKAGTIVTAFFDSGMGPDAYRATINSDEFASIPPSERAKLQTFLYTQLRTGERERDAQADRAEQELERDPRNLIKISEFTNNPDALARMSNKQIMSLAPEVGRSNAVRLLGWRNEAKAVGARTKLDPAIEKEALAEVNENDKPRVQALIRSALLDWKVDHPGTNPTEEEQRAIARTGQEAWIEIDWIFNNKKKAYQVKPGEGYPVAFDAIMPPTLGDKDKSQAYVLFNQFYDNVKKQARSIGRTPPSEEEALKKFMTNKKVIELLNPR